MRNRGTSYTTVIKKATLKGGIFPSFQFSWRIHIYSVIMYFFIIYRGLIYSKLPFIVLYLNWMHLNYINTSVGHPCFQQEITALHLNRLHRVTYSGTKNHVNNSVNPNCSLMNGVKVTNSFAQGHKSGRIEASTFNSLVSQTGTCLSSLSYEFTKIWLAFSSHQGTTAVDPWRLTLPAFCVVLGIMSVVLIYHDST